MAINFVRSQGPHGNPEILLLPVRRQVETLGGNSKSIINIA